MHSLNINNIIKIFESEEEFLEAMRSREKKRVDTEVHSRGDYKIVRIKEALEIMADAPSLKTELVDLIKRTDTRFVALDMSNVSFIYSDVLGVIISVATMLRKKEGNLCMFGINDELIELIKSVHLDDLIDVYTDEESFRAAERSRE